VTAAAAATATRPPVPRRAVTMALPLLVAVAATVAGAATAQLATGIIWGLVAAGGVVVALRMGGVQIDTVEGIVIFVGLTLSTVLSVILLPSAPATLDVLTCLYFAGAWAPAGIAFGVVAGRHGATSTSVFNTTLATLMAAAFALPAAEAFGVLQPLDTLRRGVESDFGRGDYMTVALVVGAISLSAFFATVTRLPNLATVTTVLTFTFFAASTVGFSIGALIDGIANIMNVPNFWPPDFAWAIGEGTWWWLPSWEFGAPLRANPLVETFRMGIVATVVGCFIALPMAFLASTLTTMSRSVYLVAKGFMNVTRTVPDLFWAVILVESVGFGPFAGAIALTIFAMAIMSKLLSETIDGADPGPLEAAKATGSRHFPAVRASVLPQVMPNYVAYSLYIFELTIRASFVVGFVGAGGIGRVIETQRGFFRFDRIMAIVIVIIVVVSVLDQISATLRRRLT
jgi:phosphonate transport system permease protein